MRIAIITGASSGIGAEFVRQCVFKWKELDEIWIVARRRNKLEALKKEVEQSFSDKQKEQVLIRSFSVDITSEDDREKFWKQVKAENHQVKLLINSAGVGKNGFFGSETCKKEVDMVRLNCEALVAMTYEAMPYFDSNSHIIQMASAAAFTPQPNFAVYAASKAFVYNFSRALVQELKGKGVKVTVVCPGPVDTEFLSIASGEKNGKKLPWYKKLVMTNAKDVVEKAIKDAKKGKRESVYGTIMKLCKIAGKLLPWNWILMFYRK